MANDIVLVTVSGDCFRSAVQKRIAELEVEAEEEREEIEESKRRDKEERERIVAKARQRYDKQVAKADAWLQLPFFTRIRTMRPYRPFYFHEPYEMCQVFYIHHVANHLAEMKSHLPCPNRSMQISLSLAQELGLV